MKFSSHEDRYNFYNIRMWRLSAMEYVLAIPSGQERKMGLIFVYDTEGFKIHNGY